MVASIQPACLVYRVQMRPAFIHPRIDISGRLANLKASANRSRNHIRFNHARFNSVQQQTLPAAFVADIFGRYPLRLRKWPNSSSGQNSKILGRDDTEVIRYLITIGVPFSGHLLAQEGQDRGLEVGECSMTSIVDDMPVHQAP